jgi:Skp family chaperone for outer membrane proteins
MEAGTQKNTTDKTARSADVKRFNSLAILAAALFSFGYLISISMAQAPAGAQSGAGPRLALLDVSHIFKSHVRFKTMMEEMKQDVSRAESEVKAERDRINKLAEDLPAFRKGTPEYKAAEEDLAKRQADLAVRVNLQKNEFLQREAKIYYNVYQEIWQATDYFCKQHGIDMVLRFNGEQVDVDRPDSVLAHINKPVVWYDRGLDITDAILGEVNRTAPATAGRPAARPGVPFQR